MREKFRKVTDFVKRFSREIIIALLIAVIIAVTIEIVKEKVREKTIKDNLRAVALVIARNNDKGLLVQGSGFFINSEGAFVTSYHVIKGADMKSIIAKLPSGAYYMVKDFIGIDKESDIAN